jgi:hypothetical protein
VWRADGLGLSGAAFALLRETVEALDVSDVSVERARADG